MALSKGSGPPNEEKMPFIPLFIKAELIPDECNVVDICEACERVSGHGSIDGATLVNRLWRILPFNEVSRAMLLRDGVKLYGKHLKFEGKNPFLHASGDGESQTTRLIIKNLPFSYCQSAVARNLIKAGFKLRGSLQWMKGRKRKTGRLSDFRDGRRSVFIDVPTGNVIRSMQMGSFRANLSFPDMPVKCFRCLQEGHTAKECRNEEICHKCKKPGHRRDECTADQDISDKDSDSEGEEPDMDLDPPSGGSGAPSKPPALAPPSGGAGSSSDPQMSKGPPFIIYKDPEGADTSRSSSVSYSDVLKGIPVKTGNLEGALAAPPENKTKGVDEQVPESISKSHPQSERQVVVDSPTTEYIDSVEFAELPDPPNQSQGLPSHISHTPVSTREGATDRPLSETDMTPKNRGGSESTQETLSSRQPVISSIWESSVENEESEVSLIIEATTRAEANESGEVSEKLQDSNIADEAKLLIDASEQASSSVVSKSSSSAEFQAKASDPPLSAELDSSSQNNSPKKDEATGVGSAAEPIIKPKKSGLSSAKKIKRAFSAIVSPPSDKKGPEGLQLKKKL